MRRLSSSRCFFVFLAAFLPGLLHAQPSGRKVSGQVRLGAQAAPAGVTVTLQIVTGKYVQPSGEPEVAHTVTDAKGRFSFENLERLGKNEGREFFAVSVKEPGYSPSFQVLDLTLVASGEATLDLHKREGAGHADPRGSEDPASGKSRRMPSAEAQRYLDQAQELLFRKRDPEAAIDQLKQAVRADPWYAQSYMLLGLANMQLQRWGDAQLAFSEASKVEPGNVQAYIGMGSAMNEQHDFAAAQKALNQALKLAPDSAEAHYELARTLSSQEKWEAAEPHARRAVELNPDYSGPHALMANIYLAEQDLASARREFQEYLRLDPEGSLAAAARQTITEIDKALAQQGQRH